MYSSLEFDKNTISISNKEFFFKNILKKTRIINTPFYLFFRNPLSRLESFYSNKLCLSDNPEKWEHCQLIFLNHFGIDIKSSSAQKVSFLSSITFEKFVDVLPKVFLKDLHLRPQHFSFVIKLRKLRLTNKVKYDAIVNIENNDQILKLEQILDLKLLHKNQSDRNMITFEKIE